MNRKMMGFALVFLAMVTAGTVFAQSGQNGEQITKRYEALAQKCDSLAQRTARLSSGTVSGDNAVRNAQREAESAAAEFRSLGNEHIYFISHGGEFTSAQETRIERAQTKIYGDLAIMQNNSR